MSSKQRWESIWMDSDKVGSKNRTSATESLVLLKFVANARESCVYWVVVLVWEAKNGSEMLIINTIVSSLNSKKEVR